MIYSYISRNVVPAQTPDNFFFNKGHNRWR